MLPISGPLFTVAGLAWAVRGRLSFSKGPPPTPIGRRRAAGAISNFPAAFAGTPAGLGRARVAPWPAIGGMQAGTATPGRYATRSGGAEPPEGMPSRPDQATSCLSLPPGPIRWCQPSSSSCRISPDPVSSSWFRWAVRSSTACDEQAKILAVRGNRTEDVAEPAEIAIPCQRVVAAARQFGSVGGRADRPDRGDG